VISAVDDARNLRFIRVSATLVALLVGASALVAAARVDDLLYGASV
jgi:hypothetical protein